MHSELIIRNNEAIFEVNDEKYFNSSESDKEIIGFTKSESKKKDNLELILEKFLNDDVFRIDIDDSQNQ